MSNPHTAQQQHPDRIPVFSKRTSQLLFRMTEQEILIWNKQTKDWEPFTWEELKMIVETRKPTPTIVQAVV